VPRIDLQDTIDANGSNDTQHHTGAIEMLLVTLQLQGHAATGVF
jgi:hypothetical protein